MPEVLLGLIWVQTVCKGYQQMTRAADDCGHEWALEKTISSRAAKASTKLQMQSFSQEHSQKKNMDR